MGATQLLPATQVHHHNGFDGIEEAEPSDRIVELNAIVELALSTHSGIVVFGNSTVCNVAVAVSRLNCSAGNKDFSNRLRGRHC